MATYLPPEIIEEILSRLPVKSLVRLKSACKSWNALISSHPFIRTHLLHSARSHALFIQEYYQPRNPYLFLKTLTLSRFQDGEFHVHPPPQNQSYNHRCSCNGILLLEDLISRHLLLWNPSMRSITNLFLPKFSQPLPQITFPTKLILSLEDYDHWCRNNYGICYDPATADLKVVVFYGHVNYSVYSCKNKGWSKEHGVIAHDIFYSIHKGDLVCVDGALYWIIRRRSPGLDRVLCGDLLCFESDGDKFTTVQKPGDLKEGDDYRLISLMRGRLCVWFCGGGKSSGARIWMREEGEVWRDFMRIDQNNIPPPYSHPCSSYLRQPFYVNVDEGENVMEIVFCSRSRRRILVYHPREKTYQEFDLPRNIENTKIVNEFDLPRSGSDSESESESEYEYDSEEAQLNDIFTSVDSLLFFDQHPRRSTSNRKRRLPFI